jgi:hypothetical protein
VSAARKRALGIAAALAVVVAGVAIALAVGGDDSGGKGTHRTTAAGDTTTQPPKPPTKSEPMATTKAPPSARLKKRRRDRSEVGIQTAVTKLITSAEQGDGRGFCAAVGRTGMSALQSCARAAGVQAEQLPTSDELSIQKVRLAGSTAVVTVVPGTRITLRKSGDRWTVVTVKTAAP